MLPLNLKQMAETDYEISMWLDSYEQSIQHKLPGNEASHKSAVLFSNGSNIILCTYIWYSASPEEIELFLYGLFHLPHHEESSDREKEHK